MKRLDSSRRRILFNRKGGPLLEEGILIGIGLFAFLILASIVTDIISWLSGNVSQAGDALEGLLGGGSDNSLFQTFKTAVVTVFQWVRKNTA